jgi:Uncharacterized conserved protein
MPTTLPLFDEPDPNRFDREALSEKLRQLASERIYIGGSSWKYEGWLGQVYTPERYFTRGKFSQKRFQETCLEEYAETFPIVCGDFSFYQFPSEQFWQKLFAGTPPGLKFAFKVPEEITSKIFPNHPRYGPREGLTNPTFLDAGMLDAGFLQPLRLYRDRVAVLIFEFGTFSKKSYADAAEFLADLDRFLTSLPKDFRYAVEIRNEDYLRPEYFEVLRKHSIAHVFNGWTRMPPLEKQIMLGEAYTTDFIVARALLKSGRTYEEAVKSFAPYASTQEENPGARAALRDLIERARNRKIPAYLFVNNRMEGNSPMMIKGVID